jgi:hypothetical protein
VAVRFGKNATLLAGIAKREQADSGIVWNFQSAFDIRTRRTAWRQDDVSAFGGRRKTFHSRNALKIKGRNKKWENSRASKQ